MPSYRIKEVIMYIDASQVMQAGIEKKLGVFSYGQIMETVHAVFDSTFPNHVWISPVKKIDFFLWNS